MTRNEKVSIFNFTELRPRLTSNYLKYVHSISMTQFLVAILKQKAIKLSILGAMSLFAPRERISSRSDVKELGRLHLIMLSNKSGNLFFNVYFVTCISENYSGLVLFA